MGGWNEGPGLGQPGRPESGAPQGDLRYPPPSSYPPGYPAYPPPAYQQPYPPQVYPQQPYGYWPPRHRVTPASIGWLLIGFSALTVIGGLLPWASGDTGLQSVHTALDRRGLDGDAVGAIFVGALLLVVGILITAGVGRLWVGIVGIVVSAFEVLSDMGSLGRINEINHDLLGLAHVGDGVGLLLASIATLGALGTTIAATAVRRFKQ
jgi:hypothetical protein